MHSSSLVELLLGNLTDYSIVEHKNKTYNEYVADLHLVFVPSIIYVRFELI